MYVFASIATPFIYLLKWIAQGILFLSNGLFIVYQRVLGASMWLNDLTEASVWPKE